MNTNTENIIEEHPVLPPQPDKPFPCDWPGCDRTGPNGFDKPTQLSMHKVRVHTHPNASANALRGRRYKHPTRKEQIEKRRADARRHNAAMRAKFIARGLTSRGTPRKRMSLSDNSDYKKRKYRERRDYFHSLGLNAKGGPLKMSGEALDNLRAAQQRRRRREAKEKKGLSGVKRNKRVAFVYPLPTEEPQVTADEPKPWVHAQLHHCPKCGEELTKWKKQD